MIVHCQESYLIRGLRGSPARSSYITYLIYHHSWLYINYSIVCNRRTIPETAVGRLVLPSKTNIILTEIAEQWIFRNYSMNHSLHAQTHHRSKVQYEDVLSVRRSV